LKHDFTVGVAGRYLFLRVAIAVNGVIAAFSQEFAAVLFEMAQ
jgi:hypothetical protein